MNQKCQRKKQEKDSLLANAVDNEPVSTEVPKVPTESSAAPTAPLLESASAPVESSTAAEPSAPVESAPVESAPVEPSTAPIEPAPIAESSAAPADSSSVTIPAPEEPKKLVSARLITHHQLSMRSFIILGISAAVCDVFYAPCTAMGAKDPIPLSPYVCFVCNIHHRESSRLSASLQS